MAPSASKQKRLAEKAAKASAKGKGVDTDDASSTPYDSNSLANSENPTPITSARASTEELSMAKLALKTDRYVASTLYS